MAAAPTTGVPIQLLHEAESHLVTVEMKSGDAYRGILIEAEETMNCQLDEGTGYRYIDR
jgi:small nuclear ribonucleoprotein D3